MNQLRLLHNAVLTLEDASREHAENGCLSEYTCIEVMAHTLSEQIEKLGKLITPGGRYKSPDGDWSFSKGRFVPTAHIWQILADHSIQLAIKLTLEVGACRQEFDKLSEERRDEAKRVYYGISKLAYGLVELLRQTKENVCQQILKQQKDWERLSKRKAKPA